MRPQALSTPKLEPSRRRLALKIVGWLVVAVVFFAWFTQLRPTTLGGPAEYVGVHGVSMTPTMHQGDMAIVQHKANYKVGDVIAYTIPDGQAGSGLKVIHRIVGGDAVNGYTTKGDHNSYTDVWHPTGDQIDGRVLVKLPGLAALMAKLHTPGVLAAVVGLLTFLLLAWPERREEHDVLDVRPSLMGRLRALDKRVFGWVAGRVWPSETTSS